MLPELALLVFCVAAGPVDIPPPTGEAIVAPGAKLELLWTRSAPLHGGLTEGPASAPDGCIYFSDIPMGTDPGMILKFDPATRQTTVFAADSHKSNGLAFDAAGRLVACEGADGGGRCLARWDVATKQRTVLVDRYEGKRFNAPNDLCLDSKGRIYFTDPKYVGREMREQECMAVYRVDSGGVRELTHEVSKPNGVALSPDERTLYVANTDNGSDGQDPTQPQPKPGPMRIYAFSLSASGPGSENSVVAGPRRTLIDFGPEPGCDGMTIDREGRLYLSLRTPRRPGVLVVEPTEGREVGFIPTGPADQVGEAIGLPSNVEFGRGVERNVLYITVDTSLYRIRLRSERLDSAGGNATAPTGQSGS
jgi:gluconolactonase